MCWIEMAGFVYQDVVDRILSKNRWGSEGALAEELGISRNTWTNYKKGESSFSLTQIAEICAKLGTTPQWLLFGDEESSTSLALNDNLIHIPRFDVRAAAGAGALALAENVSSYFSVERDWLRRKMPGWATVDRAGILEVDGDSMEKTLWKGDLVVTFSDPPERVVDNGGIFVVLHHGHLRVKRLHVDMRSGDVALISDNDKYPVEVVQRQYLEHDLRILAMVSVRIGDLRS